MKENPRNSSTQLNQSSKIKMFEHIPSKVQEEILKRLPVKLLIQSRSVSRGWKSLIDSHEFIAAHSVCHTHSHRLLVGYDALLTHQKKYQYVVDDYAFPRHNFALTVPLCVERLNDSKVVGSSHGLFCLSGYYESFNNSPRKKMVVLWNPSIRKSIAIDVPNPEYAFETVIGFGVCPVTSYPKILLAGKFSGSAGLVGQVKVFTLSSGALRSRTMDLPFDLAKWNGSQAVVDGYIYWLVSDKISIDGGDWTYNLIMSFDSANNEFREVRLPDCLGLAAIDPDIKFSIYKLRKSLVMVNFCKTNAANQWCDVWMMKHGIPNSFKKLFTFKAADVYIEQVLGFWKNGEPILEVASDADRYYEQVSLAACIPYYNYLKESFISGCECTFSAYSYTETLLLLNQKDFGFSLDIDEVKNDD